MSYIDIVFDGPPGHESGRFIEVEDAAGKSIRFGEWIDRGNGLWALRIPRSAVETKPEFRPMAAQHPAPCWCPYCGEPHSVNRSETDPRLAESI